MTDSSRKGFFAELKRRNVFRVAVAFIIVSWLLLQVVDILVPMLALPEWVGRFVFLLLVIGFPISLFFAWAFELTPEGVKLEKDVDRSQSVTHNTGRKLDFTIIGVLVIALGVSLYANYDETTAESVAETGSNQSEMPVDEVAAISSKPASIAVLPFANRSADESDAFFVDGMHDDLLTQLAKISALKVISRTSVLQYRDTEKSMKTIGDELGVTTLLEGGVQRAGDRIRINVQLIDAVTDEHIWAETYNRELTTENIFEIQEEISLEIAKALHAALSPDEQQRIADRPTSSLAAYEAYMLGKQRLATRNTDEVAESIEYFRTAIREDEGFADAYASLAEVFMVQNNYGELHLLEMLDLIRPLVAKSKELGQGSGIVYNAMGGLAEYEGDIDLAEAYYREAIKVSPSFTTAYVWLALLQTNYIGDFEEAARLYQTAVDLDPMATLPRYNLAVQLSAIGRHTDAMEEIKKGIEIDPTVATTYAFGGSLYAYSFNRVAEGLVWAQHSAALDDNNLGFISEFYMALDDIDAAKKWRNAYLDYSPDSGFADQLEIDMLLYEGKIGEAAELAIGLLSGSRDTMSYPVIHRVIRNYYLKVEREVDAIDLYRENFPELFLDRPNVNRANLMAAVDLVLLLRRVEDDEGAQRVAERAFPILAETPLGSPFGKFLNEVELHAVLGDRDNAIATLREIVDSGWYQYQSPSNPNPNLASIADDPEYLRLMGIIQQRVEAELRKVREMEDAGKLARTPEDLPNIRFDLDI